MLPHGTALRLWRERAGLSQEKLAERIALSRQIVGAYELEPDSYRRNVGVLQLWMEEVGAGSLDELLAGPPDARYGELDHTLPVIGETTLRSQAAWGDVLMVPIYDGIPRSWDETDPAYRGVFPLPRAAFRAGRLQIIRLPDDSMYGEGLEKGALAIIDLDSTSPYPGEIALIRHDDGTAVVRTWARDGDGKITLTPENREWGPGLPFDSNKQRVEGVLLGSVTLSNRRRLAELWVAGR